MKPDVVREKNEAVLKRMAAKAAEELDAEYDRIEEAFGDEELPAYVEAGFQKVFAAFVADKRRGCKNFEKRDAQNADVVAQQDMELRQTPDDCA